jgi:hypothetical protein
LLLLTGGSEIRINESRYLDSTLTISGETSPHRMVTLDGKYKPKSDGSGHFKFIEHYKPFTCMSDIRSGEDVYSPVIIGFLISDDAAVQRRDAINEWRGHLPVIVITNRN